MSPMSWYSGSQLTPSCGSSGVSSGISARSASVWASTARCESATGFGSTVLPDENWTSASAPGPADIATGGSPESRSAATFRSPSRGPARRTASPSSRPTRASESSATAPESWSMRAVAAWYSGSRPSRTGG